jgi:2-oxoglutarate dehydrogenase E1 component
MERFLQLAAQANIQVANLTTPAQIYHALRRQMKRDFRKPLIIMSPKSLLRHPKAVSTLEELANGQFQEIIPEISLKDTKKVENVVFVSGKLYYELLEEREKRDDKKTALVRMEQVFPFAYKQVLDVLKTYPNLKNVIWTQEEPQNMGSYQHIYFKFKDLFKKEKLKFDLEYVGRPEKASPATGSIYKHKLDQAEIIKNVFEKF